MQPIRLPACRALFCLLLILALYSGCGREKPPPGILEEESYVQLLAELFLIRSRVDYLATEREDSLLQVIMERYEIPLEAFEKSHEYYQRQPARQAEIIERVREQLTAERDTLIRARDQRYRRSN